MYSQKVKENIGDLAFLSECGIKDDELHKETLAMMDRELEHMMLIEEMEEIMDNAEAWDREHGYED